MEPHRIRIGRIDGADRCWVFLLQDALGLKGRGQILMKFDLKALFQKEKAIFARGCALYKKLAWSLERQARDAGVAMGEQNFIASHFWSTEPYLIRIGSHCQITEGVRLLTHGGAAVLRDLYPNFDCFGRITIGDYVYLGCNVLILPGVTIGNHVLVAAGSVVTKSVPDGVVVAGNPAKIVCSVDDYLMRNQPFDLGTKWMDADQKKEIILAAGDEKLIVKKWMK